MYLEKIKEAEDRIVSEVNKFMADITLPFTPSLSLCKSLLEAVRLYLQKPKQTVLPFEPVLNRFSHAKQVPKTKSRLCGGILKRGDRAYKCLQCMTEDNSIVCLGCFELQKHKGHQFELITVFGGCCDCGDGEKWRAQGFCKAHSEDEQILIELDEPLVAKFIEQQHFAFTIILHLYAEYLKQLKNIAEMKMSEARFDEQEQKKFRSNLEIRTKLYLEHYCAMYFGQLIDFNANGKYANSMTERLFNSHINLTSRPDLQAIYGQNTFFKMLFKFVEFSKTPEKICQLCITLFQLPGFRESITIEYITLYTTVPNFHSSNYSHLSSQLFTSYLAISKLIREHSIPPLSINPVVDAARLEDAAQSFVRYYYDINYLSKLYGNASVEYFIFHAQQGKIADLCDYRRIFDQFPQTKDYYGLEEIFINRMINVVQVMERDSSGFIMRAALRQLYQWFANYQTKSTNLFRPHERFFTLIALNYLDGDINQLDDPKIMETFINNLGIQNIQSEMQVIFKNICSIFSHSAHIIQSMARINENFTFFSFYFKKNITLFNLDAIFLKIAIKICEFYTSNGLAIDHSQLLRKGDRLFNIVGKMEAYTSAPVPPNLQQTTKQVGITLQANELKHFINYLTLLNEAIVSDLPLLAIKCATRPSQQDILKHKLKQVPYEKEALHYYEHILKSCESNKISSKDFKNICDVFFKEEEVFKLFVKQHSDTHDHRKLSADKSRGQPINLLYFRSNMPRITGINHNCPLTSLPYCSPFKNNTFIEKEMVPLAEKCLQFTSNLQKALYATSTLNYHSIVEGCLKSIFNLVWLIFVQSKREDIYHFLLQALKKPQYKMALEHIAIEINAYNKKINQEEANQGKSDETIKKQQIKREKLSNKRNQMLEKMNKNKDLFLPQEKAEKAEEDEDYCCLCKQAKADEDNCYIALLSRTNYNSWARLSPTNSLYSLSACGHEVHRSCYMKIINKNQIYAFCPLCKKPMNIIIPKPTLSENQSNCQSFWNEFHRIHRNYNNEAVRQEEGAIIFLSLVAFTAIKGLLFFDSFKKELKIYRTLIDLLRYFCEAIGQYKFYDAESRIKSLQVQENEQIDSILNFFSTELFQSVFDVPLELNNNNSSLSAQFTEYAKKLVLSVSSAQPIEPMQAEMKQLQILQQTVHFPQIESTLSLLSSKYLGKCPNCSLITNQQAICLICSNFVTCIKCVKMKLMTHSQVKHEGAGSFLLTHTGEVVYIYLNRFWIFESVYEDYMGRTYKANANKAEYHLNHKRMDTFREDIIANAIEARLRYNEKANNKVNHDQFL